MSEKYSIALHSQNKSAANLPYGKNYKVSYNKINFQLKIINDNLKRIPNNTYTINKESIYENNSFIIKSNDYIEDNGVLYVQISSIDDSITEVLIKEI